MSTDTPKTIDEISERFSKDIAQDHWGFRADQQLFIKQMIRLSYLEGQKFGQNELMS